MAADSAPRAARPAPVARLIPRAPPRPGGPPGPLPAGEAALAREDLAHRLRDLALLLAAGDLAAPALGPAGEAIAPLARRLGLTDLDRAAVQMARAARAAAAGGDREAVALAATAARVARLGAWA